MKCVCISCFNYYSIRMKAVIDFYNKKGYEVTYIISDFDHYTKKKYNIEIPNSLQIKVPSYNKNLSVKRLISHLIFSKKLYKRLADIKPDIVYCMFPPNSLLKEVARYKQMKKCKLIFDCYDMWPESFPYNKYEKILKLPFHYWKRLRDKYIDSADLLLCVSEYGRKALSEIVNKVPIKVLEPSLNETDVIEYNSDINKGYVFCYLGNVNHITDIELGTSLLSALAKHTCVKIHFIGEGQNLNEFINNLTDSNIKIIRHGVIFDINEKNKIFSECNFGLNIPRKDIKSSLSLKSVEYMRAGLPYLNSGIGDNYMLVKENNLGLNISDNIDNTVKEILNLSSEDLKKMHENCIKLYKDRFLNINYDNLLTV